MTTAKDSVYKLALEPSDPDFPFDLENNTLLLHLHIPKTYPTTPSRISIHSSEIPPALSRTIERAWALKVGRIKIALLDMIKWLDRDLEKMLSVDTSTSSSIVLVANNATTDFVEDRPLATGPPQNNYYGVPKQDGDEDGDDDSEIEGEVEDEERDGFEDQNEENIDLPRSSSSSTLPQHKGTHIRLPGVNLDNISLLRCISLFLIVKCSRCKSNVDVENLVSAMSTSTSEAATTTSSSSSVTKPRWTSCPICNSEIGLNFRSDFIHQHSTSLGYLDLENCTVFDLLPSTFIATCETCAVENSKLPLKRVLRASPTRWDYSDMIINYSTFHLTLQHLP